MDVNQVYNRLRKSYLNLLIYTLKNNIKETMETVSVDESILHHYGLTIEEECFRKNHTNLAPYTKAITAARLKIESYTAKQQPYPMIADALQLNPMERPPNDQRTTNHAIGDTKRPADNPIEQKPNAPLADEVIVIDSSDSEEESATMMTDDMKSKKSNNNTAVEILISVQTKPVNTDQP